MVPYEAGRGGYELAKRLGHVPVADNEVVIEELGELETREPEVDEVPIEEHSVSVGNLENQDDDETIDYVFSFDGSRQETEVKEQFPANRIGFIQTSAVLTDLSKIHDQEKQRLVDPARVKQIATSSLVQAVVPSTNYRRKGAETTHESFRKHLYFNVFQNREIEGRSLLEWFEDFVRLSDHEKDGKLILQQCPIDAEDCDAEEISIPIDDIGFCKGCGGDLYPTDRLRIHERVNDQQSNETAITNVMNLLEHISLGSYIRFIHQNSPRRLSKTAFICDGPLAQFDTGAWFHEPLLQNIIDIYQKQETSGFASPPVVGVEKTGQFVAHAKYIEDELEPGTILWMDDEYIYDYVIVSRNTGTYGEKTYYGQKFIYKANSGRIFVLNIPMVPSDDYPEYSPHAYPQMKRTISLIEEVQTALYQDSLIPVAMANEYASIPLKTGSKVLELISKDETDFND
jgi:hypothetical protein